MRNRNETQKQAKLTTAKKSATAMGFSERQKERFGLKYPKPIKKLKTPKKRAFLIRELLLKKAKRGVNAISTPST
ncbi:hypothetical protein HpNP138_03690 [Helicobacter pylori]